VLLQVGRRVRTATAGGAPSKRFARLASSGKPARMATCPGVLGLYRLQHHLEGHVGKTFEKARHKRSEQRASVGWLCRDAQRPADGRCQSCDERACRIDLGPQCVWRAVDQATGRSGATRRVVRSSTRTPSAFSRSATERLIAAFGTPKLRAAAEKPLRSTTFARSASCAGAQSSFIKPQLELMKALLFHQ